LIPYDSFNYFVFLLYPLVALILLGLLGRLGPRALIVVSLATIVFQYLNPLAPSASRAAGQLQLLSLAAYVAVSVVVVLAFAALRRRGKSQPLFFAAIAVALLPLVAVRVLPLVGALPAAPVTSGSASGEAGLLDTFGFLGLSYLTFRVIDTIIVSHDGLVKRVSLGDLIPFLLFAPTMSAGPIDRFRRFSDNLSATPRSRRDYLFDLEQGIHRIFQGFLYKFILAYLVFRYLMDPAAHQPGLLGMVAYMYAYSLYIFFDFAGYSAFAIGVGRFFGIQVPENFNRPFLSRDFKEMWNRWHITLSWWLRDHVYMRFMLHSRRHKWFGGNPQTTNYVGLFLTMGLMGFWHGLAWHYIAYGAYQGTMLVGYDVVGRWLKDRGVSFAPRLAHLGGIFLTANLFCFGLLIFSGHLITSCGEVGVPSPHDVISDDYQLITNRPRSRRPRRSARRRALRCRCSCGRPRLRRLRGPDPGRAAAPRSRSSGSRRPGPGR
jgi:membrane protein involved in D-alanine export